MTTTLTPSIVTIISESSSSNIMQTTSLIYLNTTIAPYTCDDALVACSAYADYCARENEYNNIPCQVLCPRTCGTCIV